MAHGESLRLRAIPVYSPRFLPPPQWHKCGMIPGDEIALLRRKEAIPLRRERGTRTVVAT